jgi:hypothetical protein
MEKTIERTAYHEAGHAVASYYLHVALSSVTIIPEEDSLGHIKHPKLNNFEPEWDNSLKVVDRAERMILVFFAGQVAEGRFANRHNWKGSREDWHEAVNMASYFAGNNEVLQAYVNYLWARAKTLFNLPWLWAAVEAVAKELLIRKKMGSRLTRKIIRKTIDDCYTKRRSIFREQRR